MPHVTTNNSNSCQNTAAPLSRATLQGKAATLGIEPTQRRIYLEVLHIGIISDCSRAT
jgi:hypothetical protein